MSASRDMQIELSLRLLNKAPGSSQVDQTVLVSNVDYDQITIPFRPRVDDQEITKPTLASNVDYDQITLPLRPRTDDHEVKNHTPSHDDHSDLDAILDLHLDTSEGFTLNNPIPADEPLCKSHCPDVQHLSNPTSARTTSDFNNTLQKDLERHPATLPSPTQNLSAGALLHPADPRQRLGQTRPTRHHDHPHRAQVLSQTLLHAVYVRPARGAQHAD